MRTDLGKMPFGGDYNPEQWPREIWAEDMRLLKEAGVDMLTLNVFSWATLQPSEDTYDFSQLDDIMNLVRDNGMRVFMATSTGAHPAWMATRYPEVLRVEFDGKKRKFGGRHNSCPNSPVFQHHSAALAEALAKRYQSYTNISAWHISNEYGGSCYCENCEKAFRVWLQRRYGSLEKLNESWNTSFWGHTFYDWDEIVVPNLQSEHFAETRTMFQGISLDYARFNSDSMMENYKLERDAIRRVIPDAQISTNLMGFYKPLDYRKWAKEMDFIGWDNYPSYDDPYYRTAMCHDLMRGIKDGQPFALVEQTPGVSNWHPYSALKRPGVMRLWSWQAVAHGADTVMFFQLRRSIGSCEKYHSAFIDHVGTSETRVFRELKILGGELAHVGDHLLNSRTNAQVALVFDWENWWAIEFSAGPSTELRYMKEVMRYYEALHALNISVDFIGADSDLSTYKLVIAPVLYMTKTGHAERLKEYVRKGGTFLTTFFSGIVKEDDRVVPGGYPGELRELLGIWVEEIDALPPDKHNRIVWSGKTYKAGLLCDLLHARGAEVLSTYLDDFYRGMPALTRNRFGAGEAWYVATALEAPFYISLLKSMCDTLEIGQVMQVPPGVEATRRSKDGRDFIFVLNHNETEVLIETDRGMETGMVDLLSDRILRKGEAFGLEAKGVLVLTSGE